MRNADQSRCPPVWSLIAVQVFMVISPASAAEAIVSDGDTLSLGSTKFRLDGIDAPERDHVCLNEKGEVWPCGTKVRERLIAFIDGRPVRCGDKGPDRVNPSRRIGICWVEGDVVSLNQWLVREGWALNFEPYARDRFKKNQDDARDNHRSLWKSCFSTPQDFRRGNKRGADLLGPSCEIVGDKKTRDILFPDDAAMPPGCTIKGKFALRPQITGHRGIYHVEGCRSYQRTKSPDR